MEPPENPIGPSRSTERLKTDRDSATAPAAGGIDAWQRTLNTLPWPAIIHDRDFRIVSANDAYLALAQATANAAIDRPYWEIFPSIGGPLPSCRGITSEKGAAPDRKPRVRMTIEEFECPAGGLYISRSFPLGVSGGQQHFVHIRR